MSGMTHVIEAAIANWLELANENILAEDPITGRTLLECEACRPSICENSGTLF